MAKYKQLTARQKEQMVSMFKTGNYSKRGLAKHFKCTDTTVRRVTATVAPENTKAVDLGVQYEQEKSRTTVADQRAIEVAVKERTKLERIADLVIEAGHKVALQSSAEIVRRNSDKKIEKLELSEIKLGTGIVEKSMKIVAPPKEQPSMETHLNVQQLALSQSEANSETIVTVADIDAGALAQRFKERNLPV